MVSGLAPGRPVDTEIDGKSTCGRGAGRQKIVGHRAGHTQSDGEQRGRDGPVDERGRNTHAIAAGDDVNMAGGADAYARRRFFAKHQQGHRFSTLPACGPGSPRYPC